MEIELIILIIVSLNLVLRLLNNYRRTQEINLLLAYMDNNEKDRLRLLNETIPDIQFELAQIKINTNP